MTEVVSGFGGSVNTGEHTDIIAASRLDNVEKVSLQAGLVDHVGLSFPCRNAAMARRPPNALDRHTDINIDPSRRPPNGSLEMVDVPLCELPCI